MRTHAHLQAEKRDKTRRSQCGEERQRETTCCLVNLYSLDRRSEIEQYLIASNDLHDAYGQVYIGWNRKGDVFACLCSHKHEYRTAKSSKLVLANATTKKVPIITFRAFRPKTKLEFRHRERYIIFLSSCDARVTFCPEISR